MFVTLIACTVSFILVSYLAGNSCKYFRAICCRIPLVMCPFFTGTVFCFSSFLWHAITVRRAVFTAAARARAPVRLCGICRGKVVLGQVSSDHFRFRCQSVH
jgi:hypothetical protein